MKILIFATLLLQLSLWGNDHVGIVVKKEGKAELFINPSLKVEGGGPSVFFEGQYYTIQEIKAGTKILQGSVLRTNKESKVRIVFKNGDQYNIGENTSYKVSWTDSTDQSKGGSVVNLMYGQIRAVVSKDGPRNNLKVQTKTAALGIRGTDFYIGKSGNIGETQVSVLRGEVELKTKTEQPMLGQNVVKEAPSVKIAQGQSATVAAVAPLVENETKLKDVIENIPPPPMIKLEQTTKQDLLKIQQESVIKVSEKEKEEEILPKEVVQEIKELETQALKTTLQDIKHYDPKLHEEIMKSNPTSAVALNTVVVKEQYDIAPSKPKKPNLRDLDGSDVYQKYFNVKDY